MVMVRRDAGIGIEHDDGGVGDGSAGGVGDGSGDIAGAGGLGREWDGQQTTRKRAATANVSKMPEQGRKFHKVLPPKDTDDKDGV